MNNKLKWLVIIVLFSFTVWYFLIKQSDYTIIFKVNTATGTISQGIMEWTTAQSKIKNENYTVLEKRNFDFIKQRMLKGNTEMEYTWEMKSLNDSITNVTVGIKEINHSFYNRLTAPFVSTKFRTEQIEKIKSFKMGLEDHIDDFKIRIDGEKSSKEMYVAYISMKSIMQEKAQTMINYDATIVGYLDKNKIKIIGYRPYIEITDWNQDKEIVSFNYCFPIPKNTKYIPDADVKFKTIPAKKGLQATYFGNFRTSDRAWFALLDYAKKNDIKLGNKPLEHFLDNPFNGGNELEWKTEIIIPFE
ncbi:MAG: GyrI-like domain-containing protein [Flavobacterium sp.]|uniref:GyrI-like domain-containing protein n=1 Tax=Flavobacterium sp. TaxID=239 RepID=UPI00262F0100|nr:GyrI-like domain-containing protein [Flavobacterium sp.]MDD5150300.1 GyrI-like domain-containing protein [Flavobacterium sp.]